MTNHSKLFWSRLIQKKSTYAGREFKCTLGLCFHLSQVEHCGRDVVAPLVLALRALLLHLPVPGEKGVRHMMGDMHHSARVIQPSEVTQVPPLVPRYLCNQVLPAFRSQGVPKCDIWPWWPSPPPPRPLMLPGRATAGYVSAVTPHYNAPDPPSLSFNMRHPASHSPSMMELVAATIRVDDRLTSRVDSHSLMAVWQPGLLCLRHIESTSTLSQL